jgi:hypothetical protein
MSRRHPAPPPAALSEEILSHRRGFERFVLEQSEPWHREHLGRRRIRSHFRSLRLGERQGNAIALWIELSRTIDAYLARFPATTKQMIVGAVESLLEVVCEQTAPESAPQSENDLAICD